MSAAPNSFRSRARYSTRIGRPLRQRFAFATCAELPEGDPDDALLVTAMAARGAEVSWHAWDEPGVGWAAFDAVVVRSTWDYQLRRDEFLDWASRIPTLLNPVEVLRWNTDKRYLGELGAGGLAVVETAFIEPGAAPPALPEEGEIVVKPSISAGSRDTARYSTGSPSERSAALDLIREIHAGGRTAMVQPYMPEVDAKGETALLYFGGSFSHAIRKGPLLEPGSGPTGDLFAAETIEPRTPTAAERALAEQTRSVIDGRFGPLAYMRVDVVPSAESGPLVLEVELTEPSLFFAHGKGAADRLADELLRR